MKISVNETHYGLRFNDKISNNLNTLLLGMVGSGKQKFISEEIKYISSRKDDEIFLFCTYPYEYENLKGIDNLTKYTCGKLTYNIQSIEERIISKLENISNNANISDKDIWIYIDIIDIIVYPEAFNLLLSLFKMYFSKNNIHFTLSLHDLENIDTYFIKRYLNRFIINCSYFILFKDIPLDFYKDLFELTKCEYIAERLFLEYFPNLQIGESLIYSKSYDWIKSNSLGDLHQIRLNIKYPIVPYEDTTYLNSSFKESKDTFAYKNDMENINDSLLNIIMNDGFNDIDLTMLEKNLVDLPDISIKEVNISCNCEINMEIIYQEEKQ